MAEAGEQSCVFCKIANGKDENAELLFQDEAYAVFRDHKPAASTHLLVVPKAHISDAKSLKKQDLELVTTMVKIGEQVLQEHGGEVTKARFGFHWPPFCLIYHLHLHVIHPVSEAGFISRQIFKPNSLWFVTPDWLMDRLNKMPS